MVLTGMGPWTVTIWLNKWPGENQMKIEYDKVGWDLLTNRLNRAMHKSKRTNVLGKYIPPNMVRFEIRSKR